MTLVPCAAAGESSCCCAEGGLPAALSERPALSAPLLQVPVPGARLCLWEDGTELTADYFWSVPDNAELVLLSEGQAWQGCEWRAWECAGGWRALGAEGKGLVAFLPAGCATSLPAGERCLVISHRGRASTPPPPLGGDCPSALDGRDGEEGEGVCPHVLPVGAGGSETMSRSPGDLAVLPQVRTQAK